MTTFITAHAGCDDTPDNSYQYLAHAVTCGADVFEVDVRCRPDGVLYLGHDILREPDVLLADAFDLMRTGTIRINCDLKEPNLERAVLALADAFAVTDRVILTGSVSAEALCSDGIRSHTWWNIAIPHKAERESSDVIASWLAGTIQLCKEHGVSVINVNADICSDIVLNELQKSGISVSAWTINDPALAQRLLDHHVYNITSRKPGMVLALRS